MRARTARFLLLLGGPVFLLVLLEVGLRLVGPAPPSTRFRELFLVNDEMELRGEYVRDSELFWRLLPSRSVSGWSPRGIRINSRGMRGPEPQMPKPLGRLRLAVAGDSCAFGLGVSDDANTYVAVLARELEKSVGAGSDFKSVDWVNAGISGYSSFQGRRFVEHHLLPLAPDVVVIAYGLNDYFFSAGCADSQIEMPASWVLGLESALEHSELFVRMRRLFAAGPQPLGDSVVGSIPPRRVLPGELQDNLAAVVEGVRRVGAAPILVNIAVRPGIPLVLNPVFRPLDEGFLRVFGVLIGGHQAYTMTEWPGSIEELEQIADTYPDLPLPHYFLGRLLAASDHSRAEQELALARELDHERKIVAEYNSSIAEVAQRLDVPLFDQASLFAADDCLGLFLDERHLSAAGQKRLGEALSPLVTSEVEKLSGQGVGTDGARSK